MKAQYKIIGMAIVSLITMSAAAELAIEKPSTRIDFNTMIDANNNNKEDLQKSVVNKMEVSPEQAAEANEDKAKVMDLVDVEIGLGQDRPIVDRRFNSIGEAIVDPRFSVKVEDEKKDDSGT